MESNHLDRIIPDPEIDRLISRPSGITENIKRDALLEDTIAFLPKAMHRVTWQVKKIVPLFEADTQEESCYKIWHRLYTRLPYQLDDKGKEQIRSPRATWWGRRADCDDFSVFVSAILINMGIPHLFRIAMYDEKYGYQHIYVVAKVERGREVVIDCVLNQFNKEVPYIKKIDKHMDLQFLDGVEEEFYKDSIRSIDSQDLLQGEFGDLGKTKFGEKLKEGLHDFNRVNPATVLLRSGVLVTMKINLFKVAGSLKYTYLTEQQAVQKGLVLSTYKKLKTIREKLEKIFYGAGGKIENLKKAILTGKGNHNKAVPLNGLGTIDTSPYDENSSIAKLLGDGLYRDEIQSVNGLGQLGIDPGTDSAIAAATGAIAAISALIKGAGPMFNKGASGASDSSATPGATDNSNTDNSSGSADATSTNTPASTTNDTTANPTDGGANSSTGTPAIATDDGSGNSTGDGTNQRAMATANDTTTPKPSGANDGLIKKATQWAKDNKAAAVAIGVTVVGLLGYGGYKFATSKKSKKEPALSGVPKKRGKKKTKKSGTKKTKRKVRVQRLK
jgi:hypothetical protein